MSPTCVVSTVYFTWFWELTSLCVKFIRILTCWTLNCIVTIIYCWNFINKIQINEMLDYKITKKHYPRTNSNSVLEFIFEKDPNLFLKKNKILIRGTIEIDSKYVLENGWVSKLFSMLTVEVDSQTVSTNKNRWDVENTHSKVFPSISVRNRVDFRQVEFLTKIDHGDLVTL